VHSRPSAGQALTLKPGPPTLLLPPLLSGRWSHCDPSYYIAPKVKDPTERIPMYVPAPDTKGVSGFDRSHPQRLTLSSWVRGLILSGCGPVCERRRALRAGRAHLKKDHRRHHGHSRSNTMF
jgi:hypothetical protein